jgi:hypothetical protein
MPQASVWPTKSRIRLLILIDDLAKKNMCWAVSTRGRNKRPGQDVRLPCNKSHTTDRKRKGGLPSNQQFGAGLQPPECTRDELKQSTSLKVMPSLNRTLDVVASVAEHGSFQSYLAMSPSHSSGGVCCENMCLARPRLADRPRAVGLRFTHDVSSIHARLAVTNWFFSWPVPTILSRGQADHKLR